MARRPRLTREERLAAQALGHALSTPQGAKRFFIFLIIATLLVGAWWIWENKLKPAPAQAPIPTNVPSDPHATSVRIATWNLRKFSERDKPGQYPPDLVAIAGIIKSSSFDLIAIQEVQQTGQVVQKLRRQLGEPWRHYISPQTGNNERYAFLYRADRVEMLDEPVFMDSAGAIEFDRVPLVARFRAGSFDFTLVTAHLWYGDKANNPRRKREADLLAQYAGNIITTGSDRDVIILGDFNEMRASPNLPLFESLGFVRLNREPTNLSSTEIYDALLINPRHTREYAGNSGVVRFDESRYGNDDKLAARDISDHRPAFADFSITGPDDD